MPGDEAPAGQPGVNIDSPTAPGRTWSTESCGSSNRATTATVRSRREQTFDWTPDEEGAWIQVTFDLVAGGDTAPYVGYFIALRDFNDARGRSGGNVLIDGAATGKAIRVRRLSGQRSSRERRDWR